MSGVRERSFLVISALFPGFYRLGGGGGGGKLRVPYAVARVCTIKQQLEADV